MEMREINTLKLFVAIMLSVMIVACSKRQGVNKTTTVNQYEAINSQAVAMLNQNPDSAIVIVDSLEATGLYPECVLNMSRGTIYARMGSLRFAEFYLRKAVCEELHQIWPRGYYNGLYNLSTSIMMKGNLEEALKLSKAGYEEVTKETDPSLKVWG